MEKKKKIIIISVIAILVILAVIGVIWYSTSKKDNASEQKVVKLYENLQAKNSYGFTITLDDKNKIYYAKQDEKAYTDTIYNGSESKFVLKDGNAYLVVESQKAYYTYQNNQTDLKLIEEQLENVKELQAEKGNEKIEDKTYQYEEYNVLTRFAIQDFSDENEENIKTRFYFTGDKLAYIKTIGEKKQELVKIDISNNVDKSLFEIPKDYKEM